MGIFGDKKPDGVPENAALLTTGALMLNVNNLAPRDLRVRDRNKAADILESFWGVDCHDSAIGLIKDFLTLEDSQGLDEELQSLDLDDAQAEMLNYAADYMAGHKRYGVSKGKRTTKEQVDAVKTTVAWDIERAGFIARLAFACDYLSDEEAVDILTETHRLAEEYFNDWVDYAISYVKARSLVMATTSSKGDMTSVFDNGILLEERKWGDVWSWAPLS